MTTSTDLARAAILTTMGTAPRRIIGIVLAVGGALSCGGSGSAPESTGTDLAALCAGAPVRNRDGSETLESCPFLQQADNITNFGDRVQRRALDATGAFIATVSSSCDKWAVATDAQGVVVILDRDTGAVVSHGTVHPGQAMSQLPARVAAPLRSE